MGGARWARFLPLVKLPDSGLNANQGNVCTTSDNSTAIIAMKKKNTSRNLAAITVVAFSAIFLSSCGDNKTSAGLEKGLACTGNSEVLTEGSDHALEQAEQQVTEECVTPEEAPTIANKQPLAAATTDSNIGTLEFLQHESLRFAADESGTFQNLDFIFDRFDRSLGQTMINPDENILISFPTTDPGSATEGTLKLQCTKDFAENRSAITGEFRVKLCHSTKARNRRMCVTVFARPYLESFSRTVINDSCRMARDPLVKGDLAGFCDAQDLKLAVKNSGTLLTKNRKGFAKNFHSLRNCSAQIISGDGTTVARTKKQFGFLPYRLDGVKFQSNDVRRLSTLAPGNSDGAMCVHSGGSSFSSSQTGPCPLADKPQKNANFKQGGPIEAVFFTSTGLVPPSFNLEKGGKKVPLVVELENRKRLGLESCFFLGAGPFFGDISRLRCYQHTVTLGYDVDRAQIVFNESHGQDYRITTRGLSQAQRSPASWRTDIFTIDDPDTVSRPPADNPGLDCNKIENASHPDCIADFFR